MDNNLIGSVINALPLDAMISGPLQAMIRSQIQAGEAYVRFILSIGVKDGKAATVEFEYEENVTNETGESQGSISRTVKMPLLAIVSHPNIVIEEGTIDFELEVSQADALKSSTAGEASLEAKIGWGPFNVSMKGRVTHKSEQTRKTDTRAKYSISTRIVRQGPPEALQRIIELMTNAQTNPITTNKPDVLNPSKKKNTLR